MKVFMVDKLFIYDSPFLVDDTEKNRYAYLTETARYHEYERDDESRIHDLLLKYIVENELVQVDEGKLINSLEQNAGSWIWMMNWMNMRSFVCQRQLSSFIEALSIDNQFPINSLLSLHARLGTLFDFKLLNTMANRTIRAIQLIPYDFKADDVRTTWETIHKEVPFIWLVILIQTVLKNESITRI